MSLTRQEYNLIMAGVSQLLQEQRVWIAEHAVVVAGTWAPQDQPSQGEPVYAGTVQSTIGKTAAIIGDDGDTGISQPRILVLTTQIGDQYGPVGGERMVIIPTDNGPVAAFVHAFDDTPAAPSGERWICHRNPQTGKIDAFFKHTNDGAVTGDGKGGMQQLVGSFGTMQSADGHLLTMDDNAQAVALASAKGQAVSMNDKAQQLAVATAPGPQQLITLYDAIVQAIQHVVPTGAKVTLGDLASAMTSVNAAINQSHVKTYDGSLQSAKLQDYIKYANLLHAAGTVSSGQLGTILAALIAGWTNVTGGLASLGSLKVFHSS